MNFFSDSPTHEEPDMDSKSVFTLVDIKGDEFLNK